MKIAALVSRYLLGLVFVVFGSNKFLEFIPVPKEMAPKMGAFFNGLIQSGYLIPLIGLTEVVFGALLLVGIYVPLAAIVLMPVSLNIFLTHVFVDPAGFVMGAAVLLLNVLIIAGHWPKYAALRQMR